MPKQPGLRRFRLRKTSSVLLALEQLIRRLLVHHGIGPNERGTIVRSGALTVDPDVCSSLLNLESAHLIRLVYQ